jgi:uncharacterized protein YkuJ
MCISSYFQETDKVRFERKGTKINKVKCMQMKNTYTDFVGNHEEGHLVDINEYGG